MGQDDKETNAIEKIKFEVGQEMGLNIRNDDKSKKNFKKL